MCMCILSRDPIRTGTEDEDQRGSKGHYEDDISHDLTILPDQKTSVVSPHT